MKRGVPAVRLRAGGRLLTVLVAPVLLLAGCGEGDRISLAHDVPWTDYLPTLLIIGLAAGTFFDARRFGRRYGFDRGFPSLGPWTWAIFVLVFWIGFLPWYVGRRVHLSRSPEAREKAIAKRRYENAYRQGHA